jgi:hypothetical protein
MSDPAFEMFNIDPQDVWHNAGDVAQTVLAQIAIHNKDRADEYLDSKRTHGGLTLDEYFAVRGEN